MRRVYSFSVLSVSLACLVGLSACNGDGTSVAGQALGQAQTGVFPPGIPTSSGSQGVPAGSSPSLVGPSCQSSDSSHYCLGMKYVVYTDSNGKDVVSQDTAVSNVTALNKVWAQCNIGFQIEEFLPEDPKNYGLEFSFGADDSTEMDRVRKAFQDTSRLLLVTTGSWDHSGSSANAWTEMPGSGLYGAVFESSVGDYPNIIAHELGHYLNLDHVSDQADLMNPVIYDTSTQLDSSQCDTARAAVASYWKAMLR